MTKASQDNASRPAGFLTLTLHAHLPYVVNHGTWPHGLEWLHEAAAETYLPLLRVLKNLERDKIRFNCNLNLSPILLEQLSHPVFLAEFPRYLSRKIVAAREDEAFFIQSGDSHLAETARFWQRFFAQALEDFNHFDHNLVAAFSHFNDIGLIDIITCGATHGYLPLLGTDESVRAQIRTAVDTHTRHFGKAPRGIWAPECGYRPAGSWTYPVPNADGTPTPPSFNRIGVEQALSESGLEFFFVDTHLVEESRRSSSAYAFHGGDVAADSVADQPTQASHRSLYQPYFVDGPYGREHATTIFPRDPSTGIQVWSGDTGYPGDAVYLDFHKKRWPGGHRYWRVTGHKVDMGDKQPYYPHEAAERTKAHAAHFVHLVHEALKPGFNDAIPPILCSPFDAELFGHWWFEGPLWLDAIARNLHDHQSGIQLISCADYLDQYPRAGFIEMHEGSWGAEGTNKVWLNPDTSWTYTHIYPAEIYTREVCTPPTGKSLRSADASSSSSAANSCSWNPPTGSSSLPQAPLATTPRFASSPIMTSLMTSRPSGRASNQAVQSPTARKNVLPRLSFATTSSLTSIPACGSPAPLPRAPTHLTLRRSKLRLSSIKLPFICGIALRYALTLDLLTSPQPSSFTAYQRRSVGAYTAGSPVVSIPYARREQIRHNLSHHSDMAVLFPVSSSRLRAIRASPLTLWHLLSLDGPTVAALWTWFIASANSIRLSWAHIVAMFLAVWMLYVADRLLDSREIANHHELEARHYFHNSHRTAFSALLLLAAIVLTTLLPHLDPLAMHLYLILGIFLFGYFTLIHATRSSHRLPKEIAVGLFFAAATFIPTVARRPDLRTSLLPLALLFTTLCSLNCLFIYEWEHTTPTNYRTPPATGFGLRLLPFLTGILILLSISIAILSRQVAWPIPGAIAVSAALLLLLHNHRYEIARTTLRAAADLTLTTPLLLLPFLHR